MRVRVSGDLAELGALGARFEALATEGMREINRRAAVAIDLQVEKQFARGESAEGERWANKADGSPSFLQKSGKMKRSKRVTGVSGIALSIDKPAGFHQTGTERMPARPIAPTGNELPPNWRQAVAVAAAEVFEEIVR